MDLLRATQRRGKWGSNLYRGRQGPCGWEVGSCRYGRCPLHTGPSLDHELLDYLPSKFQHFEPCISGWVHVHRLGLLLLSVCPSARPVLGGARGAQGRCERSKLGPEAGVEARPDGQTGGFLLFPPWSPGMWNLPEELLSTPRAIQSLCLCPVMVRREALSPSACLSLLPLCSPVLQSPAWYLLLPAPPFPESPLGSRSLWSVTLVTLGT